MTKEEKKRLCSGCYNNFYNGNNDYQVAECWCFKKSKVCMKKEIHISQIPPWKQAPIKTLSCYHRPQFAYIDPKKEN